MSEQKSHADEAPTSHVLSHSILEKILFWGKCFNCFVCSSVRYQSLIVWTYLENVVFIHDQKPFVLQFGVDDNATVIISAPTTHASPVGVDFYEMRRRNKQFETGAKNYNYGPFGVLINMVGTEGAGYFHCNDLFIAELLPPSADR